MMSYRETITYLDSFINYEKKAVFRYKESLKLERIRDFLRQINDPQESFRSIHVAGTKGKGSTCVFIANILRCAGYRTGLYTSPHLADVRERIRVLLPGRRSLPAEDFPGMISRKELAVLVSRLKPAVDDYCRSSDYGPLSFFEVYTALSFMYFKEKNVDFAVLETGLGGRLDATNVVSPSICGITSISFDHMDKLGNTLGEIAREKAGIIKGRRGARSPRHRLIVVSAPQKPGVRAVLRQRCEEEKAILYEIGRDMVIDSVRAGNGSQGFSLHGPLGNFDDLRIRLRGKHQLINAAVAVSLAAGMARQKQLALNAGHLRNGLYQTFWPARFEVIQSHPAVVLDAAHNVASAQVLASTFRKFYGNQRGVLVVGISKDKDIRGICKALFPLVNQIIITRADNPRAEKPQRIRAYALGICNGSRISVVPSVRNALQAAKKAAGSGGVVIVSGSIFVVAEARDILRSQRRLQQS